jgi:hypothetical protein
MIRIPTLIAILQDFRHDLSRDVGAQWTPERLRQREIINEKIDALRRELERL